MVGYGLISLACVASCWSLFPFPVPLEETRLLTLVLPYSQVIRESGSSTCNTRNCSTEDVGPSYTMRHVHVQVSLTNVQHTTYPASCWGHTHAYTSTVRSVFSGHTNSKAGYSFRIWSLFRVLCFVAIAMSPLSPMRTVVFLVLLVCSCGISLFRIPRQCAATPHRRHYTRCWRRCSSKA